MSERRLEKMRASTIRRCRVTDGATPDRTLGTGRPTEEETITMTGEGVVLRTETETEEEETDRALRRRLVTEGARRRPTEEIVIVIAIGTDATTDVTKEAIEERTAVRIEATEGRSVAEVEEGTRARRRPLVGSSPLEAQLREDALRLEDPTTRRLRSRGVPLSSSSRARSRCSLTCLLPRPRNSRLSSRMVRSLRL